MTKIDLKKWSAARKEMESMPVTSLVPAMNWLPGPPPKREGFYWLKVFPRVDDSTIGKVVTYDVQRLLLFGYEESVQCWDAASYDYQEITAHCPIEEPK
jgi:hypothetical protein